MTSPPCTIYSFRLVWKVRCSDGSIEGSIWYALKVGPNQHLLYLVLGTYIFLSLKAILQSIYIIAILQIGKLTQKGQKHALVCRSRTDFCVLILYPATLQNSLVNSNSLFCRFHWLFYIGDQVLSKLNFASSSPISCLFLFLPHCPSYKL